MLVAPLVAGTRVDYDGLAQNSDKFGFSVH
jgi:hypothetical protein